MFAILALGFALAAPPQQTKSAEDAIYTAAQADRGKAVAEAHCARCHGANLTGLEGPALVGSSFLLAWETKDLDALFTKIRETMPDGAVSSISDEEKLDTVAYLLQQNGFPAGQSELPHDSTTLKQIIMSRKAASAGPRTGAMVTVAGCLTQGEKSEWLLTNATEPSLGASVRLLNVFPSPAPHKGHKVNVTGLVMKDAAGLGVNVISLEMASSSCP
jgi:mono/diheme cytochrome c family protein